MLQQLVRILPLCCFLVSSGYAKTTVEIDLPGGPSNHIYGGVFAAYGSREIKQAFKKGLDEYLKVGDSVHVRFFPTTRQKILSGRFSHVQILFKNSAVQGLEMLNIRRGRLLISDVEFDVNELMNKGKLKIQKIDKVQFSMRIYEKDLNAYLMANQDKINLTSPNLKLSKEKLMFTARVRNRFFSARVKTEGRFEVNEEARTVDFKTNSVSLNSLRIPGFVASTIVSRINPILSLNRFSLMDLIPLKLKGVELGNGFVEFTGS
jgi:hypothetical protein